VSFFRELRTAFGPFSQKGLIHGYIKNMGTALPFIFASQKRSLAKTQRVDERASLIYKTAFLLIQKIGPKIAK
jgi:hypothetical protein